jgi:hypothetical protein
VVIAVSVLVFCHGYSAFVYLLTVDSVSYHDKNQTKSVGLVLLGAAIKFHPNINGIKIDDSEFF